MTEIAVVYFRAGYSPADYVGRKEWDARLKLERSTAIKSPSIGYHLVGTKKVQQVLAKEGQVRSICCCRTAARCSRCVELDRISLLDSNASDGDVLERLRA